MIWEREWREDLEVFSSCYVPRLCEWRGEGEKHEVVGSRELPAYHGGRGSMVWICCCKEAREFVSWARRWRVCSSILMS